MKTFKDLKLSDCVYYFSNNLLKIHRIINIDEISIDICLDEKLDINFSIPRINNTYYCGIYSCPEAILKELENEIEDI